MIIAGTGHRPGKVFSYNADDFNKLTNIITEWLVKNKPTIVVSGMAIGFDQALAKAAIDLNIPVIAAIPFIGQESKWPTPSRVVYKILLDKCAEKIIVTGGDYAAYKLQKRNEWMVKRITTNDGNILLAFWDGSEGGTANCMRFAKTYVNLHIVNLYDKWANS